MFDIGSLRKKTWDILVVGAGPAGISAAINAATRKKEVLLLEHGEPLRKLRKAKKIPNYPGFPNVGGHKLAESLLHHLTEMGVTVTKGKALQITFSMGHFTTFTEEASHMARSLILAVGMVSERKIPGEAELVGEGVSYCVTCDGLVYQGEKVAVIADSKEGEQEAVALAEEYGCEVVYLPGYDALGELPESIQVLKEANPKALNTKGGEIEVDLGQERLRFNGVFIMRENLAPSTIIDGLEMRGKFIGINEKMATNIPGVYAAGDCIGPPFQIAKAVGQGQIAALNAVKYLSTIK